MATTAPRPHLSASASGAKLVFAGPVGAGKTTAIRTLADDVPVSTEMPLTDGAMGEKTTTTVALDFATVALDDGTPLLVYGLPGQEHFSFMRGIVIEGAVGVVIVLDGSADDVVERCDHWLGSILSLDPDITVVIGITHTDAAPNFSLRQVRDAIRRHRRLVPVLTFDARDRGQTTQVIRALLVACA